MNVCYRIVEGSGDAADEDEHGMETKAERGARLNRMIQVPN